jgi:hypothetical protein
MAQCLIQLRHRAALLTEGNFLNPTPETFAMVFRQIIVSFKISIILDTLHEDAYALLFESSANIESEWNVTP